MAKEDESCTSLRWGTWEELLLACAVKRHGFKNWDNVAMELQSRTSLATTAHHCKLKYLDLNRRFTAQDIPNDDAVPWLEDLRQLRVSELRQELQRYDVSILSLQSKVKRLEEERGQSLKESQAKAQDKPDLVAEEVERSEEYDKRETQGQADKPGPDEGLLDGKLVAGDESDRENRSFNESNSTGKSGEENTNGRDDEPVRTDKPDPVRSGSKPVSEDDSCHESSDSIARNVPSQGKKVCESAESKESSDVQSSVSLRKGRRRKENFGDGEEAPENEDVSKTVDGLAVKSQPLVRLLEIIRAHKQSSLFERRLESQDTDKYKNTVRRHIDLETIQTRVELNSYTSSTSYTLTFYRDLLLLCTNAITFFPGDSLEATTAHQLRVLVSNHMKKKKKKKNKKVKKETQISNCSSQKHAAPPMVVPLQPKPEPAKSESSLLANHKSSAPIIVCRKRSSISTKNSSSTSADQPPSEEEDEKKKTGLDPKPPPIKPSSNEVEEEPSGLTNKVNKGKDKSSSGAVVTGARSSRRNNKNFPNATNPTPTKKQNASPGSKPPASETSKSKKRSAADFLKRIKQNSPMEKQLRSSRVAGGEQKQRGSDKGKESKVLKQSAGNKKRAKDESSPSKRSVGRPPKKAAAAAETKRGRGGRNGGAKEEAVASNRPRKRARR